MAVITQEHIELARLCGACSSEVDKLEAGDDAWTLSVEVAVWLEDTLPDLAELASSAIASEAPVNIIGLPLLSVVCSGDDSDSGNGSGDGYGHCYGSGSCDGEGYGSGSCYGSCSSDGDGFGDGYGSGSGDGSGYGDSDGSGDGYGSGDRPGDGYGYGN